MKPGQSKSCFRPADILSLLIMAAIIPVACRRIEFEPAGHLFVTTDTITFLEDGLVRMTGSILNPGELAVTEHGFCWSDSGVPTFDSSSSKLGPRTSAGLFSSEVPGLEPKTNYYIKAYAISGNRVTYGNELAIRTPTPPIDSFITDIDGNSYPVVRIGQQHWLAENLRTTRYADGTPIPFIDSEEEWSLITGIDKAYSWYQDQQANAQICGAFYSWAAAMNGVPGSEADPSGVQGVCPDGWHIPSDAEWIRMHLFLGMRPNEADRIGSLGGRAGIGNKMKGFGYPLWPEYHVNYNSSGFSALPCGLRNSTGEFSNLGDYAYFWSSTDFSGLDAWCRYLQEGVSGVVRDHLKKSYGLSVRCVSDY